MYINAIWIKALSFFVISVLLLLCDIYAIKKLNWKPHEFLFALIICIVMLVFGCVNSGYALNPQFETINANYSYEHKGSIIFGREYFFVDENEETYGLIMDPITSTKFLKNKNIELNKKNKYTIMYEKKSKVIVSICKYYNK